MKNTLCFLLLGFISTLVAQESQQISTGSGYNSQSFVHLESGTEHKVSNATWDIAFTMYPGEAGVFINESVGSSGTPIEAFYTVSTDFSAVPDPGIYELTPLMNLEKTWSYGAFNEIRTKDPTDYGWGYLNTDNGEIIGENVFVVRLRNGTDLKLQIQSLIDDVFTFRYANLDGSDEITRTIAKADHAGKLLAYYSFASDGAVDVEPEEGFDLLFVRYYSLLDDPGGGEPIPYLVTGILSGPGVEVAQADGIDPKAVMFADYQDELSPELEIIGHDWKEFDLGAFEWLLVEDRVYFVKAANNRVWKIQFTDFDGSSTGNATFFKTDLGLLSAVKDEQGPVRSLGLFPNPANTQFDLAFSVESSADAKVNVRDMNGNVILHYDRHLSEGFNVLTVPVERMLSGIYAVEVQVGNQSMTKQLIVAH